MKKYFLIISLFIFSSVNCAQTTATIISENANLRGTPTEMSKVVDTISQYTSLEIIRQRGAWFLVQTTDYVGWISRQHNQTNLAENNSKRWRYANRYRFAAPPTNRQTSTENS